MIPPASLPRRLSCLVPFCRRTRGDRKNDPLPADITGIEWVCHQHWRAVPKVLRAIHRRAERDFLTARASRDAASTLMAATPTPRPRAVSEAWREAGRRYERACARADRMWKRCKRHAIEAAGGLA